jgi:uncharacterized protein YdhG (YjbR/CyaY superfamily)
MVLTPKKFKTVDEYISSFPIKQKKYLKQLSKTIKQAAPEAEEVISYNMPALKFNGIVVYYAAHTHHIGFYPGHKSVNEFFKEKLKKYETSKGTIKFPYEKELPFKLVKEIVKYKLKMNMDRVKFNNK